MCKSCSRNTALCPLCTAEMEYGPAGSDGSGRSWMAGYACPECGEFVADPALEERLAAARGEEGFGPVRGMESPDDGSPSMLPPVAIGPAGYTVDLGGRPVAGPFG